MDLAGFTSFICTKIGMSDNASLAACASYVQRRYQMIYDRRPWKDSIIRVTASPTANNDNVVLPDGIDRVVSIRYGNHFLDPVDDTFFVETDPTIFERTGIPQYYQEYTEQSDNSKRIRLYPIPAVDGSMFIVGKRTLPPLVNGSDMPILRNVDNVIAAYAMGDMLEKLRQNGKAQAKFTEAALLYDEAVKFETDQANVPRRAKNLTVSGDSLAEMVDAVCARVGQWTPDAVIMIRDFMRRNYRHIYDSYLWPESLAMVRVNSDGAQVILPWYICSVIAVRANPGEWPVRIADPSTYYQITPQIFEQNTGPAQAYTILTPVAVEKLSPVRELLSISSSDPNDNTFVMVRGESAGDIVSESVQLNGTSPVYTIHAYDTPLTIAKGITTGNIIVVGASTNLTLSKLMAGERERKRMRLWIQPSSSTPHQCLLLGKRAIQPLVQDEDTPLIRNCANVLIQMSCADAWSKQGDKAAAADCKASAAEALKALLDLTIDQNTVDQRIFPVVEPYAYAPSYDGSFLKG